MKFKNRVCEWLHQDHVATIALVQRLEFMIARHKDRAPELDAGDSMRILSEVSEAVRNEIARHFAFEESHLFPYLAEIGAPEMGILLTEEHETLRPLGAELAVMAQKAQEERLNAAGWARLCRVALEYCEGISGHAQKEEAGLLPMLEDSMDAATEARLYTSYAGPERATT